jgi:hypothetical protein
MVSCSCLDVNHSHSDHYLQDSQGNETKKAQEEPAHIRHAGTSPVVQSNMVSPPRAFHTARQPHLSPGKLPTGDSKGKAWVLHPLLSSIPQLLHSETKAAQVSKRQPKVSVCVPALPCTWALGPGCGAQKSSGANPIAADAGMRQPQQPGQGTWGSPGIPLHGQSKGRWDSKSTQYLNMYKPEPGMPFYGK